MNRFRMPARRALSLAAAAVLGLAGVLFVASPASAHITTLSGTASCVDGRWVVDYTVTPTLNNNATKYKFWDANAQHLEGSTWTTDNGVAPTSPVGGALSTYPWSVPGSFHITQTVPGTSTKAHLRVKGAWSDGFFESNWVGSGDVSLSGSCVPNQPSPTVSYQSKCDGTVLVTLRNNGGKAPAVFTVTGVPGTTTVAADATPAALPLPAGTGHITVSEASVGAIGNGYDWTQPEGCTPVKVSSKQDCSSLTVQLDNPDGPAADYSVVSGDKTVTGTLAPGASKTLDSFPASTGTTAVVTIDNLPPTTITWTAQEACAPPDLPKTGSSNLTPLASIGGALLVGGAGMIGLLFLLRRRRTTASG